MMKWLFKKRDTRIAELEKEIDNLNKENSSMFDDIKILIGDDKKTSYHQVKQKWRLIVDFENSLWYGESNIFGKGVVNQIVRKNKL